MIKRLVGWFVVYDVTVKRKLSRHFIKESILIIGDWALSFFVVDVLLLCHWHSLAASLTTAAVTVTGGHRCLIVSSIDRAWSLDGSGRHLCLLVAV